MPSDTLTPDNIKVELDKKTVIINRFKRKDLAAFYNLYQELVSVYFLHQGAIGSFLMDERGWDLLTQISSILPIEAQKELGFDITVIEEDFDLINNLFFTTSFNSETGELELNEFGQLDPGLISRLNRLDFLEVMQNARKTMAIARTAELTE
jgi:hypothetical protein